MAIETRAAQDALDGLIDRINRATMQAVADGAGAIESLEKAGVAVRSGTLRRSVDIDGPRPTGLASFSANVGPTVIYGRIRELGGDIYPTTERVFVGWAIDKRGRKYKKYKGGVLSWFSLDGHPVFARHVYQTGRPSLKLATEAVRSRFRSMAASRWADAIRSV